MGWHFREQHYIETYKSMITILLRCSIIIQLNAIR
jgi:hypothetical protein